MRAMSTYEIDFQRAKTVKGGIKVFTNTLRDYNALRELLRAKNREHHSYQLPDERMQRVIIRGLTCDHDPELVAKDLVNIHGIQTVTVVQLVGKKSKQKLNLFLAKTPDKRIWDIRRIRGLDVSTEQQKRDKILSQCHRCQRYGHG